MGNKRRRKRNKKQDVFLDVIEMEVPIEQLTTSPLEINYMNENIYLDRSFLNSLGLYLHLVNMVNQIEQFTRSASYKFYMIFICLIVLGILTLQMQDSFVVMKISLEKTRKNEFILKQVLKNKTNKQFINDRRIFIEEMEQYMNDHYGLLIQFMDEQLMNVKLENKFVDNYIYDINKLNIFITTLPLILNLSWWTNSVVVSATFLNAYVGNGTNLAALRNMGYISFILALILIVIHGYNSLMLIINLLK